MLFFKQDKLVLRILRFGGQIMKLKLKKRLAILTLVMTVCGTLQISNVVKADSIVKKGIKEYNGTFNDKAFAWTGSNISGNVKASVVRSSDYSCIVDSTDTDGYIQNPQTSYWSTAVIGLHASETAAGTSYP